MTFWSAGDNGFIYVTLSSCCKIKSLLSTHAKNTEWNTLDIWVKGLVSYNWPYFSGTWLWQIFIELFFCTNDSINSVLNLFFVGGGFFLFIYIVTSGFLCLLCCLLDIVSLVVQTISFNRFCDNDTVLPKYSHLTPL